MRRLSGLGAVAVSALLLWLGLTLAYGLVVKSELFQGANPIIRPRLEVKEPFQPGYPVPKGATGAPDEAKVESEPADPRLDKQREPYLLISDSLSPEEGAGPRPTAARCRDMDFEARLERTGNYRQMTNNYTRAAPDSCLQAPLEFVRAFYKVDGLPASEGVIPGSQVDRPLGLFLPSSA